MNESGFDWRRFLALTVAGTVGILAVIPYQLAAIKIPEVGFSDVVVQAVVLNGPLVAIAAAVGTGLAPKVSLEVHSRTVDIRDYGVAALAGLAVAVGIVALDVAVFQSLIPASEVAGDLTEVYAPVWARALAGLYGGITEEILLRYGLLTLLFWVGSKFGQWLDGLPESAWAWTAIVLTALIFGAAHLPATAAIVALTPVVVARALALNGLAGVLFGWLYWKRDLLSAMVAHFAADVVIVVLVPMLF